MANEIHPTAIIYEDVELGDNNYIGAYCIIGAPPEHKKHWDNPNPWSKVIIGNNNVITGLVTIDGCTDGQGTIIKDNCFIMKHAHIGHDCTINNNVTISCGAKIGGHSVIGEKSNIGLNAVLHQFSNIKVGCMIGASAFFKGESEPYTKYAGVPAKSLGQNIIK